MMRTILQASLVALALTACGQEQGTSDEGTRAAEPEAAPAAREPSKPEISVTFEAPADGAQVTSPFEVRMAAQGVDVVPAGTMEEGTGHMHILVDAPFVMPGYAIPSDEQHIHYGDGSTTATLDLPPGDHVLRLQLADGAHKAFEGGEYRDVIRVEVIESERPAGDSPTAETETSDEEGADEGGEPAGPESESGG